MRYNYYYLTVSSISILIFPSNPPFMIASLLSVVKFPSVLSSFAVKVALRHRHDNQRIDPTVLGILVRRPKSRIASAAQSNINFLDDAKSNDDGLLSLKEATAAFQPYFNFPLDEWQIEAGMHVKNGKNVVVCAPTGAGKTVVGELALQHCVQSSYKGIYCTPLKALSNQKFLELRKTFGPNAVGLSTGDMSINIHESSVTVMTTEVYRNMAWKEDRQHFNRSSIGNTTTNAISNYSRRLENVAVVVLDEFHYMGLRGRGSVWEESVITSQPHTQIVALSATLPNANQLAQWIQHVTNRKTELVIANEKRPVPLRYYFATSDGFYPLFRDPEAGPGATKGLLGLRSHMHTKNDLTQDELQATLLEGNEGPIDETKKQNTLNNKEKAKGGGFATESTTKKGSKAKTNNNNKHSPSVESFPRGLQLHPDLLRRTRKVRDKVDRLISKEERKYQEEVLSSNSSVRRKTKNRYLRYSEEWVEEDEELPKKASKNSNLKARLSPKEERRKREQLLKREMSRDVPKLSFLVKRLEQKDILPAIFFIFSRAGCDAAAREVCNFMLKSSATRQAFSKKRRRMRKDNNIVLTKDKTYNFYNDNIDDDPFLSPTKNIRDINGRIFRDMGALSDDQITELLENDDLEEDDDFTLYDDDDIYDSNTDGETILSHNPFSDENLILFSNRGLLPLKSVREVAARIQAFNQENIELAFSKDVIIQFLLGVSSHHAGHLAAHRSFVESLFQSQLMKVVFATETLAAGINMPARTTVICSMSKRDGDSSVNRLETSNLLQMAGRAGRRGMDTDGTCVIVATPFEGPEDAASILLSEIKPITSQFSPSYTLAVNLVSRGSGTLGVARDLVQRSFAMWEKRQRQQQLDSIVAYSDSENNTATLEDVAKGRLAAQQQFLSSLNWIVLDAIEQQDETYQVSIAKLEECLSILATSKSLRKASYSYEAMVRLLSLQLSTLDYLQEEAKDLNSYLNDFERSIFDIESDLVNFAEEDTIYISDQIKAQQALIQKHERDVVNHPFTALAAIANHAMKKDNHTSTVLEKLIISARGTERNLNSSSSSSDIEEITAKEIGEFAKAAKLIERKQKGATLGTVGPPANGPEEEAPDDAFTDMLLLIKVLESYGCLIPLENFEDQERNEQKSYELTSAGKDISMLNFDNALWALVALGGAWDVKYESYELDEEVKSLGLSYFHDEKNEMLLPTEEYNTFNKVDNDLPRKEARDLVSNLCCLSASELAGYVSCLVSEGNNRDASVIDTSYLSFDHLSLQQILVVRCSVMAAERLLEVQRKSGLGDLEFPCRLDLSVCSVVTAWTAGCTWNEALEMSKMAPGDLARVLHRAMDALRQFGSLPYHPARSWDSSTKSGAPSFGIHPNIRKLCREAANAMNRYPLKDPLPLENEYIEGTEIVDEFAFTSSEDELEDATESVSMFSIK